MSTTAPSTTPDKIKVTVEVTITKTTEESVDNVVDVKRVCDDAIKRKQAFVDAAGQGSVVSGTIRIGKQTHKL